MKYGQHPQYETFAQRDHRLFHEKSKAVRNINQIPVNARVLEPGVDYLVRWGVVPVLDRGAQPSATNH